MSAINKKALWWYIRQQDQTLDAGQRAELDAWLAEDVRHQGAYVRAAVLHNALRQAGQPAVYPGEDRYVLRTPGAAPDGAASDGAPTRRRFLRYGALAAGVAAVGVSTALTYFSAPTTLTTAKGEARRVQLADTSVATLNTGSELTVQLGKHERRITLSKGEAWFAVAKDKSKPFIVAAGEARARAVGTAFSVRRLNGGAEILVTEGLVEVWAEGGNAEHKLVAAGERSYVPDRATQIEVARQPAEVERKLAWRDGKLVFLNQTLGEAVADFNRYSARKIVVADPALVDRKIFGRYQTDAPEQFARDIGAYLDVPVGASAEKIVIGRRARRDQL